MGIDIEGDGRCGVTQPLGHDLDGHITRRNANRNKGKKTWVAQIFATRN